MEIVADLATFRIQFPEFDSIPDATVVYYLDICLAELNEIAWGLCYGKASLYCSAHEIALSQNRQANTQVTDAGFVITSAGSGAVTQASAGQISATYSENGTLTAGSDADVYYYQTTYGQHFLKLKRECLPIMAIAGCC